jgi:hypothetical protein
MMDMDVYASERLMYQRVDEERQLAELRRVQREVGEARQGRLGQWRSQVLAQLGGLFVSVGQRLEQAGQVQAPCAEESVAGRA